MSFGSFYLIRIIFMPCKNVGVIKSIISFSVGETKSNSTAASRSAYLAFRKYFRKFFSLFK